MEVARSSACDSLGGAASGTVANRPPGTDGALDEAEIRHLGRMLAGERRFGVLMVLNLIVAAGLAVTYAWSASWSGLRAVLVVLILLNARAHLRQLRSARLLRKLAPSGKGSHG